ncbi:hypothetical protein X566_01505 [Afipia sp. P52-10]|uniref:gp436 family protein n=1 Tax=Afipia sp. P52-10 TaxID=1429916 RepID=UPI0003DF0EE0|nr:DUF1320 domain-containing protein [Afipia sp. P52-10]ETR79290.1 hypothetical protein X566_01505 [Afipia sp. P52-10]
MTYASQAELEERYGQPMLIMLTDRADPPANVIDAAVVVRALEDADAEINGYLGRYKLPLSATPPLVRNLALPIAVYKLHRDAVSEKVRRDYEDAVATLKLIATGTVRLDVAGVEPPAAVGSGVRITDRDRPLTEENMKGFI